jgi:alkylated DNA repair protein alkB family protein 6
MAAAPKLKPAVCFKSTPSGCDFFFKPSDQPFGEMAAAAELVDAPPSVSYLPDFINSSQEGALMQCIYKEAYSLRWVQLRGRRLQNWGGLPSASGMREPEALPYWLATLCDGLVTAGIFPKDQRPNHVLINEYLPGGGIMAHTDGPLYTPLVATVSLGDPAHFILTPRRGGGRSDIDTPHAVSAHSSVPPPALKLGNALPNCAVPMVVQGGSLLVFSDEAYTHWEHEVAAEDQVLVGAATANLHQLGCAQGAVLPRQSVRVSLTVRHVPLPAAP